MEKNIGSCKMLNVNFNNALHHLIEIVCPYLISGLELIGIAVLCWATLHALWECIQNVFMHKDFDAQIDLAKGLAMSLEFKMAAEILKTVLIQSLQELYMLGAVILLRSLLSLLIHYEIHLEHKEKELILSKAADAKKAEEEAAEK